MNTQIFLSILSALMPVTDFGVSGKAIELKQCIELLTRDPQNAMQLNQMLASAVCNDPKIFEEITTFVAACLTRGDRQQIPFAVQRFQGVAQRVAA